MTQRRMIMQPGCLAALMLFAFFFLVPFFFAQLMFTAVSRLGFSAEVGLLILVGIFLGSTVNIPVRRIVREKLVPEPTLLFGFERLLPRLGLDPLFPAVRRQRQVTIIAVNLGGCLIPLGVALYETARVLGRGPEESLALAGITALNIYVCYRVARPVPSLGIVMPALLPPLVAAVPSLLLVPDFAPPIAFVSGVAGPLIGADLLHLNRMKEVATGLASIGGAGTFDGIVLSGMLAALLA